MKRSGSNRIPRKIGNDDEGEESSTNKSQSAAPKAQAVKRPIFGKNKKRSSLRISFGPGDAENDGEDSSDSAVVTPKKSNLSRIAIEKNAARRAASPLISEIPRPSLDEDRPSYSKDVLAELRNSTPSTPKDLDTAPPDEDELALEKFDISSKFGSTATLSKERPSAIPTEAEIQEKKARRARLAQGYNAEDPAAAREDDDWDMQDDDEFRTNRNEITLRPKDKYEETRLVREDEDIAEGFEEYVEDGNITLGRKAEREARKKRRADMASLIAAAEGSEEDSDDSEAERNAAYEAAQTRAGTYGKRGQEDEDNREPPKAQPIPDLKEVVAKLDADVTAKEARKQAILKQLEEIKEEKVRIAERQQYIQKQLEKTGDEYEKLRQDAGMPALPANGVNAPKQIERGLDSLGTTPVPPRNNSEDDEEDYEDVETRVGFSM
ncbi:nineteen complex-related protein 2-domain-containing protein [Lophiotrema nucula]|uniref:Nineteen complex-related protein 2-domain-containing protein n=1 Tax=Lophiotrema nucula TaxID=690887 RepID=A0A6A5ZFU4_9PLEO|nr:nineteen complex-related protein 2-domain-containing protein [Lophiotrema nucula]